jgi:chemosensory pili system protein ChpA (sensor histidine kinase/response regulator)
MADKSPDTQSQKPVLPAKAPLLRAGPPLRVTSPSLSQKRLSTAVRSEKKITLTPQSGLHPLPEVPPLTSQQPEEDYLPLFRQEVTLYLKDIQSALEQLQRDFLPEEPWTVLRARFHTIRGSAATLALTPTEQIATSAEDLALRALDQPGLRSAATWRQFLQAAHDTALSLQLPGLSLPLTESGDREENSHHKALSLILLAQRILDDWQLKPELPSYQVEFKQALDKLSQLLKGANTKALSMSFGQFSVFVENLQPGQFIDPFFVVARRCLGDASAYLNMASLSHGLPWTRKWSFYFSSLRVALAAEAKRPTPFPSSTNSTAEPVDPEMLDVFSQEAVTQFEQIEASLIAWEKGLDATEQIKTIRRCFHTLKGAANSVDLRGLGHGFHLLEDYLDTLNPASAPEPLFHFLLTCVDQARDYIRQLIASPSTPWSNDWKSSLLLLKSGPATETTSSVPVDPEMLETFVEEAITLFEQIESAVLAWEKLDQGENQRAALRRHFHTLKGASNSIGLNSLGHDFHLLEDYMDTVKAKEPPLGLFEFLLRCSDQVRAYVEELSRNNAAVWPHQWGRVIDDLKKGKIQGASLAPVRSLEPASAEKAFVEERQVVRVEADRLRQVMHQVNEMIADHRSFESTTDRLPSTILRWNQSASEMAKILQNLENDLAAQHHHSPDTTGRFLRQLEASLTELRREFKQQTTLREECQALTAAVKEDNLQFRRNSRRLQNDLASLNMAPVSGLFRRLQRVFRDALKEEKKEAELILEGEQTLLDKTVVDALYGPLLHVVRNAVAHGIETPDKRQELGKKRSGFVHLNARPLSNQVILEVRDDGSGIHEAMVRKRAIERGMIPADAPDLNPEQIVELLFRPGFSTKDTVSSVAGRGVGLDVVKGEIESMNGSVHLDYQVGRGSTWTIKVPLTLSASEALIVQVGTQRLALPLSYVQRCVRFLPGNQIQRQGILFYQDERGTVPCLDLAHVFQMGPPNRSNLGVLVDSGLVQAVFMVDSLIARREIVTKDIGSLIGSLPYLSGATLDSDGSLTPILQIPHILQRLAAEITRSSTSSQVLAGEVSQTILSTPAETSTLPIQATNTPAQFSLGRPPRILLCDDSASVRKAQEKQLLHLGYQVITANDGKEALELLEKVEVDLVMTDLEMPRIDGFGLVKGIRALERLRNLPIIVITSRALEKFATETVELGATACLGKPFAAAQFERLIQNEPRLSNLRKESFF